MYYFFLLLFNHVFTFKNAGGAIYLLSISRIQCTNHTVWLSWRQLQGPTPPQPNRNSALFDRCVPVSTDAHEFGGDSSFLQVVLFV